MPFCSKCGTQNLDTASVCTSCGNDLNPKPNLFSSGLDGGGSAGGFMDKIKNYIDNLMLFFDSGEFFKVSWRWMNYHLWAVVYALFPVALIGAAIKFGVFDMPAKIVIFYSLPLYF